MKNVTNIDDNNTDMPKIIYLLFLGAIFGGFTAFPGIVMVYIFRRNATDWLVTHYAFLESMFWKGLVIAMFGALLKPIFIGYLIWAYLVVWIIKRSLAGIQALARREAIHNPSSWFF